ncbi:MAG: HU family DNA-binding protein [Alphaproteobacteria bacterium]
MNRQELIARLSRRLPHLLQRDVDEAVRVVFSSIEQALLDGKKVELRNFGVFTVKNRAPRMAFNPRAKVMTLVQAKKVPFFKISKTVLQRLNKKSST